jgi:predicted PurR-regulated permease PerM
MDRRVIEISWGSLWRVFVFSFLILILFLAREVFMGLFLALVIASGLEPVINKLERLKIPRTLSVIMIFIVFCFILVVILYALIPRLIIDINSALIGLKSQPIGKGWLAPFLDITTTTTLTGVIGKLSRQILASDTSPIGFFMQALGGLSLVLTVVVSSFYLSLSRDGVERFIRVVFPRDSEEAMLRLYARSKRQVAAWFHTQILLSIFVGTLVLLATSLLGVRHAIPLALLAAVLEIVPFVGPVVAGSVAVMVALSQSTTLALITLLIFVVIQQIEGHLFVPILMKRSVGLHPVIVIIALIIGGQLEGILGVLIAVPAAAVFQEIVEDWSDKRRSLVK